MRDSRERITPEGVRSYFRFNVNVEELRSLILTSVSQREGFLSIRSDLSEVVYQTDGKRRVICVSCGKNTESDKRL